MLEIESVTWKQPEPHRIPNGTERGEVCRFYRMAHWNGAAGRWGMAIHIPEVHDETVFVDFCPLCGADLLEEKPVLP